MKLLQDFHKSSNVIYSCVVFEARMTLYIVRADKKHRL